VSLPLAASNPAEVKMIGGDERIERYVRARNTALSGQIAEREGRFTEALEFYRASRAFSEDYKTAHVRIILLEKRLKH